jgi:hypothetical protein
MRDRLAGLEQVPGGEEDGRDHDPEENPIECLLGHATHSGLLQPHNFSDFPKVPMAGLSALTSL